MAISMRHNPFGNIVTGVGKALANSKIIGRVVGISNGEMLRYNQKTNVFGAYAKDGIPKLCSIQKMVYNIRRGKR